LADIIYQDEKTRKEISFSDCAPLQTTKHTSLSLD